MRQAVACRKCGRPIPSSATKPLAGCPFCFVQDALDDGDLARQSPAPLTPVDVSQGAARMGKYSLVAKLGAGGMGEVWKAWDTELERWVALKLLRHVDSRELERFTREARTAAALTHPNIAAVYEAGEIGGRHYIAMQLVVGRTLEQWPRKDRKRLVSLVRDAARAVGMAHKHGIVHRDLKPANLMTAEDEAGPAVFVMDFGLAKRIEGEKKLSGTATLAGTPAYMSPEHTRGRRADARSDVYSLGVTLYELLTGRLPFQSDDLYLLIRKITDADASPPRTLDRTIDRDLDTIVMKCLDKDPSRRYANGDALARDLDRWLAGEPVVARPAGIIHRIGRKLAKRKMAATAIVMAMLLAGVLAWWSVVVSPEAEHRRLYADAMNLWADARGAAMVGMDPVGIPEKARKAREAFERSIQAKDAAKAQWMRARCLELEGNYEEGLKALQRALDLDPADMEARVEMAKSLILMYVSSRGEPPIWTGSGVPNPGVVLNVGTLAAETEVERGWRERGEELLKSGAPTPEQADLLTGLLAMGRAEFSRAATCLSSYTRSQSWDAQAHRLEGTCRFYARDYPGAAAAMDRALSRVPTAVNYGARARVKTAMGLLEDAIADYGKVIDLAPNRPGGYANRGKVKVMKGLWDEAITDLSVALDLDPKNPRTWNSRGYAKYWKEQYEDAISDYDQAIRLNPKYVEAYSNRGGAKRWAGRVDEAISDYETALAIAPNDATTWYNLGIAMHVKGLREKSIAAYTKAVELAPEYPEAWLNMGRVKVGMGFLREAVLDFQKALQVAPPNWPTRAETQMRLSEASAQVLFSEGNRDLELKKHREAIEKFKGVVTAYPKTKHAVHSAYNVACCFALLGDKVEALGWLEKAVEMGWKDGAHIERDSDLDAIRGEPRFKTLLDVLKRSSEVR